MPAVSESQQQAAAMALQAKRGEIPVESLKGPALAMFRSMSRKELEEFASTKHKGLPKHKDDRVRTR